MHLRPLLVAAVAFGAFATNELNAQEHPARRVANIVSVAVEEYGKGIDERGRMVSEMEYREAADFLADAREQAARLSGDRAAAARDILDSIVVAVTRRAPPSEVKALEQRFARALGSEAALEMPRSALDLADGRQLYARSCESCHGPLGKGGGVAAGGMKPAPPAIGTREMMHDVSPATMYRIVSVGIAGTPMAGYAATLTPEQRWNVVAYLVSQRTPASDVAEGEGLYMQRCAQCHGALGAGDGVLSRALSRVPQEVGSLAWQAARTDDQLAATIIAGIPGTAMPPSRDLDQRNVASIVAYLRTLPSRSASNAIAASPSTQASSRDVIALLDDALAAARASRTSDAGDRAFDAYIAFEPMETPARARNPGLVAAMERQFAEFKSAVRAGDIRTAESARDQIEARMPMIVELTRPTGSGFQAFWQSFLIILREGLEAILVIGAVVAFLLKTGHRERLRSIWWGVAWGIVASAATAIVLKTLLAAMPATREVIEGATMLIAVAVLFSVSYWLISKVEAAKWQQFIREKVTSALDHGGGKALTFVAFLAVYREGAETALFYQALFNEGAAVVVPITLGIVAGAAALAVVFTLFYRFGVRIPLRQFFTVTSVLLYYMAFVFMGKGMRELQEGNVVSSTRIPGAPHVDAIGLYPTVETLLAQLLLVALFVFAIVKTFWPKRSVALPTMAVDSTAAMLVEAQLSELRAAQQTLQSRIDALENAWSRETATSGDGD
jgi:high-affinity iron transporter